MLAPALRNMHSRLMAAPKEPPVMQAYPDKAGGGWHVIVRYHHGRERRVEGFSTEAEAMDWIVANAHQVDE